MPVGCARAKAPGGPVITPAPEDRHLYDEAEALASKFLKPMVEECPEDVFQVLPLIVLYAAVQGMELQGWKPEDIHEQVDIILKP